MEQAKCRYCRAAPAVVSGLCRECYFQAQECGRRALTANGERKTPDATRTILPGPAKVHVLAERASQGLCLFHPSDALDEEDDLPFQGLLPPGYPSGIMSVRLPRIHSLGAVRGIPFSADELGVLG